MNHSSDEFMTLDDAVRAGHVAQVPAEHVVPHRLDGDLAYIAVRPMDLGTAGGGTRHVEPGDLLDRGEVEASRHQLRRLIRGGFVIQVPAGRGVVGVLGALFGRVDRLEQALAQLAAGGSAKP
jgi:hypothetical protein